MPSQAAPFSAEPSFLTERDLARRWRLSERTLQRRRAAGTVPAHIVLGRRILYPLASVLAFEDALLRGGAVR